MAEMTRADFQSLLDARVKEVVEFEYASTVDQLSEWFTMDTSDTFEERRSSVGEMPMWTAFGGNLTYEQFYEQYQAVATHIEFTQAYRVGRTLVDDDLTGIFRADQFRKMVNSGIVTRQVHGARIWNFMGANDNMFYSRSEGVPIASDAHTTRTPNVSTAVGFDNLTTADLSPTAYRALRQQMRRFANDQGHIANIVPDTLVVPIELEQRAQEILFSPGDPDTARRTMNPEANSSTILVPLRMNSTENWGLMNQRMAKENNIWFDYAKYVRPDFRSVMDFETYQLKSSGYMRYSYLTMDWRWIAWALAS